jgi:chitinase
MNKLLLKAFSLILILQLTTQYCKSQALKKFRVVGYYAGPIQSIDSFKVEQLTHLIFCFCGLKENKLQIRNAEDSAIIFKMVALKKRNPSLKIFVSLGGWGGCETCSDVFNSSIGIKEFAKSVKEVANYFKIDGIDLDWEYPVIKGFPGHTYRNEDAANFTELVKELRQVNNPSFEISFAAGGFTSYIDSSIQWKEVIKYVDFINIMSYDLVHGYSVISGHHTPLYSTPQQIESTDHAVKMLIKAGVPKNMLVIGGAFYGRFFQIEEGSNVDLYMPCKFSHGFSFKNINDSISAKNGFEIKWDDIAKAPYAINNKRKLLATYDDKKSIALKTKYAKISQLGGIMFWQLYDDKYKDGLLETISNN